MSSYRPARTSVLIRIGDTEDEQAQELGPMGT
jgi:hypothetical protein